MALFSGNIVLVACGKRFNKRKINRSMECSIDRLIEVTSWFYVRSAMSISNRIIWSMNTIYQTGKDQGKMPWYKPEWKAKRRPISFDRASDGRLDTVWYSTRQRLTMNRLSHRIQPLNGWRIYDWRGLKRIHRVKAYPYVFCGHIVRKVIKKEITLFVRLLTWWVNNRRCFYVDYLLAGIFPTAHSSKI